jgi:dipeptidyl-peptidase-3
MMPGFSSDYLREQLQKVDVCRLPLRAGETLDEMCDELFPVMFDPQVLPKRVNKADGEDLIQTSACHFYEDVTQAEAEAFYDEMKKNEPAKDTPPSFGLNSTLVKENGEVKELVWSANGRYANAIRHIVYWLRKAAQVAENEQQRKVIDLLISYYESGNLQTFNEYCIEWLKEHNSAIDFINGFIEVYGDPLGLKGSWEGLVEYIDETATQRTRTISNNAQWFEDHSPVDPRFRKPVVKGVSANVICAVMLGGDE